MKKKCVLLVLSLFLFSLCGAVWAGGGKETVPAAKTVNFISSSVNWQAWPAFQKDFEDTTGIKINPIMAPADTNEFKMKLTTMLSSGDSSIDTMYIDELMSVGFSQAKFLEPLDDVMTPEVAANYAEDVVKNISSFNGKIYTVPGDTQPMFFFVNKDMFKEAGVKIPTTEAEFMAAAKAFTKDGNFGYGASWTNGGFLYNDAIRWMYAYGGDYLDWKLPGSRQGLQKMYDLIYTDKVASPSAVTDTYDALNQKFKEGKYAMIFQWSYIGGVLGDQFPSKFDIVSMPTFKTNKTLVAGWHFAMSAYAKNKDAAKEFLKFIASVKGQTHFTDFDVKSAAHMKVLKNPENIARVPMLKYIGDYLGANSLKPRPSNAKITEIMDATEPIAHAYLSKQISLDECVEKAQKEIDRITASMK